MSIFPWISVISHNHSWILSLLNRFSWCHFLILSYFYNFSCFLCYVDLRLWYYVKHIIFKENSTKVVQMWSPVNILSLPSPSHWTQYPSIWLYTFIRELVSLHFIHDQLKAKWLKRLTQCIHPPNDNTPTRVTRLIHARRSCKKAACFIWHLKESNQLRNQLEIIVTCLWGLQKILELTFSKCSSSPLLKLFNSAAFLINTVPWTNWQQIIQHTNAEE